MQILQSELFWAVTWAAAMGAVGASVGAWLVVRPLRRIGTEVVTELRNCSMAVPMEAASAEHDGARTTVFTRPSLARGTDEVKTRVLDIDPSMRAFLKRGHSR